MKIIYTTEGIFKFMQNVPEEPKLNMFDAYGKNRKRAWEDPLRSYYKAIQKAKDTAIPFEDQEYVRSVMAKSFPFFSCCPGPHTFHSTCSVTKTPFDLPDGYRVEVKKYRDWLDNYEQVAILKPVESHTIETPIPAMMEQAVRTIPGAVNDGHEHEIGKPE